MAQSLIYTGAELSTHVSGLIPNYEHISEDIQMNGELSFQYNSNQKVIFVNASLKNSVRTTRAVPLNTGQLSLSQNT